MATAPSQFSSNTTSQVSTSKSALTNFSPISTLERQYAGGPRLCLFLRTNANCCLPGGVEALLKLQGSKSGTASTLPPPVRQESNTSAASSSDDDPFSFLNQNGETTTTAPPQEVKKKKNIAGFLKNVAKKTSSHIERGMTELAIRADQGRKPDMLVMGLHDSQTGTLLSMTEPQPLPYFRS